MCFLIKKLRLLSDLSVLCLTFITATEHDATAERRAAARIEQLVPLPELKEEIHRPQHTMLHHTTLDHISSRGT